MEVKLTTGWKWQSWRRQRADDVEVGIDNDDLIKTDNDEGGATGYESWSAKAPNFNVIGIFSIVSFGI